MCNIEKYKIIRSCRRTIAIIIERDGSVTVRAPNYAEKSEIDRFVSSKEEWIKAKSAAAKEKAENRPFFDLCENGTLYYLGQKLTLHSGRGIFIKGDRFYAPLSDADIKERIIRFYKDESLKMLTKKTQRIAESMGFKLNKIKITSARTRWGSCNFNNDICFSFRLIMCSDYLIDYVIVHELCHFKHKNHGSAFYKQLKSFLPDYEQRQKLLKQHGFLMEAL